LKLRLVDENRFIRTDRGLAMPFVDKDLKCSTCGLEFAFSAGEQQFFSDKGFTHDPNTARNAKP
jgi:hypothetical protein